MLSKHNMAGQSMIFPPRIHECMRSSLTLDNAMICKQGIYARFLAVTWGKPVFGGFPILYWIGFSSWLFWPVEFGVSSAHGFFCRFFGHPSIFWAFCCFFAMVLECVKTCVIHASEMVASYEKARVITLLRECIDFEGLSAIQFCPRGFIRVTFKNASDKEEFVRVGSLTLDGHDLSVTSLDKPYSLVYVHYFPVEGDDALIRDELGNYGEVISIKHQSFSGIPSLLTGSHILTMVLSDPVPAEFRIDDYPVRVWYKGIPPFCQICKISGHKAADCQFNGKCRRCGSPNTRRMRASGRGVSLLYQWRLQSLRWCLTPLRLLCHCL